MPKEALILYVRPETRALLDRLADEQDRSVSAVARRVLEEALAKEEKKGGG
jgi:predicted transcriptional regulator